MKSAQPLLLILSVLVLASACVTPTMNVSGDLGETGYVHPLVTKSEGGLKLIFGDFMVHGIKQDAVSSLTESAIMDRKYGYQFQFTGLKARSWPAKCESLIKARANDGGRIAGSGSIKLTCKIDDGSGDITKRWVVKMAGTEGTGLSGEVRNKRTKRRVKVVLDDSGTPVGYEMHLRDRPIAAVQTIGDPKLWLHQNLGGRVRSGVVSASGALLLFDRIVAGQ